MAIVCLEFLAFLSQRFSRSWNLWHMLFPIFNHYVFDDVFVLVELPVFFDWFWELNFQIWSTRTKIPMGLWLRSYGWITADIFRVETFCLTFCKINDNFLKFLANLFPLLFLGRLLCEMSGLIIQVSLH